MYIHTHTYNVKKNAVSWQKLENSSTYLHMHYNFFSSAGIEPRALHMLGKHSIT
jgi:hypothetical protein